MPLLTDRSMSRWLTVMTVNPRDMPGTLKEGPHAPLSLTHQSAPVSSRILRAMAAVSFCFAAT